MTKIVTSFAIAVVVAVSLHPLAAQARSFLSGHGTDTGTCSSVGTPCRSFAYALSQTPAGGEIAVLDTAGYGPVTITRAVSIVNSGGVEAGITVPSGGTGITINAGSNDTVILRGLTIDGEGSASNGIVFGSGQRLEVIDSVVRNFTNTGIEINSPTTGWSVLISNTHLLDIPGNSFLATSASNGAINNVTIDRTTVSNSGNGIQIVGRGDLITALISNCVIDQSSSIGVLVGQNVHVTMINSTISSSAIDGLAVVEGGLMYLSRTMIVNSTTAVSIQTSGIVFTAQNNDFGFYGSPVSGGSLTIQGEQ